LDENAGFELDAATGVVQAISPGRGRVRARVEELLSDTISITVTGAPDSIAAVDDSVVTIPADAIVSPQLTSILIDLTTDTAAAEPLSDKVVNYTLVHPARDTPEAQGVFLTVNDSVPGPDQYSVAVTTDRSNQAYVVVRRFAGASFPDSAVVTASATTAVGQIVSGSPVRFILVLEKAP
jgi:hypothetical protein